MDYLKRSNDYFQSSALAWLESHQKQAMAYKTFLVTGSTGDIGFATCWALAFLGAKRVFLACRHLQRGQQASQVLASHFPEVDFSPIFCDLSDAMSTERTIQTMKLIDWDVIIHNAATAQSQISTEKNLTCCPIFYTNFVAPVTLSQALLEQNQDIHPRRFVFVSSLAHHRVHSSFDFISLFKSYQTSQQPPNRLSYAASKSALMLYAQHLQCLAEKQGLPITCLSAHPGFAVTQINQASVDWGLLKNLRHQQTVGFVLSLLHQLGFCQPDHLWACLSLVSAACLNHPRLAYVGPRGLLELTGQPGYGRISRSLSHPRLKQSFDQVMTDGLQLMIKTHSKTACH